MDVRPSLISLVQTSLHCVLSTRLGNAEVTHGGRKRPSSMGYLNLNNFVFLLF